MCGIAGILTNRRAELGGALAAMRAALAHRGPDDSGVGEFSLGGDWRLGLVQTRLSIIDLSPAGHQPMIDARTGSAIVFNGEIYNHEAVRRSFPELPFASSGDTATLLQTWIEAGPIVLQELRGMFAFALWDGRRRQLTLCRDRLGVKPLYIARVDDSTWLFGSEIRALLATDWIGRRVDSVGLESYLATGAVVAPRTMIAGIESLLPAEVCAFDLADGGAAPSRRIYWRPAFAPPNGKTWRREEAIEMLRPVLAEATRLRMVADVPVGAFLSGGIDSGAIVASLATQGFKLRTFSVVFDERAFDESAHSSAIAACFGTEHHEIRLRPADMVSHMAEAIAAYDQPSIDGINTYFISQATRATGAKVALSGLGGDELFAGYPYFRFMQRISRPAPRAGMRFVQFVGRAARPTDVRLQKLGGVLAATSRVEQYAYCRQVMAGPVRASLLESANVADASWQSDGELESQVAALDAVNAHSRLELSGYLANMLLRDTDQMSMAHALEVREPLLDHVLIDAIGKIPGPLKLLPGTRSANKGLLTDSLPAQLPPATTERRKMGFVLPWEKWLRAELAPRIDASFSDRDVMAGIGLRPQAVQRIWGDFRAGRPNARYTDILALHHLIEWARNNLQ